MKRFPIAAFLIIFLLTACGGTSPVSVTPSSLPPEERTPLPAATATANPAALETATPTPAVPTLLLVAPAGCATPYETFCQGLEARAVAQNWQVSQVDALPAFLPSQTQAVVLLPGLQDLSQVMSQVGDVPVLAVGYTDAPAMPNLSVLDPQGATPEKRAFLAGYIAALATEDWRTGIVVPAASGEGTALQNAFLQGTTYFCGLCRPAYPPFHTYPVVAVHTEGNATQTLQTLADQAVATAYLPASLSEDTALLEAISQASLQWIVEGQTPATLQDMLVARIFPSPASALDALWPALTGGDAVHLPMPIGVDAPGLSPGRLRLAQDVATDLMEGRISVQQP